MQNERNSRALKRFDEEIAEFSYLFPDTDPDDVPYSVWEKVKKGMTLAKAYGEYVEKEAEKQAKAFEKNESNKQKSPGDIRNGGKKAVFSAKEVRAMSPEQIKRHYAEILYSMEAKGFYD